MNANLTFKWLRDLPFASGPMLEASRVFLPVALRDGEARTALSMVASGGGSSGRLEIVLAGGIG